MPNGASFELDDTAPGVYLHPRSERVDPSSDLGKFGLSSDAVVPSFSRARELKKIICQIPKEKTDEFLRRGYTIGGMMIWPGYRAERTDDRGR